jgi:hypothetical protein
MTDGKMPIPVVEYIPYGCWENKRMFEKME